MSTTTMKKICSIFIGAVTAPAYGEWIDLPAAEEDIQAIIDDIQSNECEEYMISDFEGLLNVNEFSNPFELNEKAEELDGMDENELDVIECLISEAGFSVDEAINTVSSGDYRIYENCYSMTDIAYEVVDECGYLHNVPDTVANYFDYEAFGRDLDLDGHFYYAGSGVYVETF